MTSQTVEDLENLIRDRMDSEEDADNLIYLALSIVSELSELGEDGILVMHLISARLVSLTKMSTKIH